MTSINDVLKLDLPFYKTFTNVEETSWGYLFLNENQPNWYDSNHAHIIEKCMNPDFVINEVTRFYEGKNIIPRFYIYNLDEQQLLISNLRSKGFRYEEFSSPVQLWDKRVIEFEKNNHITIEKVTFENYEEALEIEGSIKEFGGKEAIEKVFKDQFNHPAFTHFLLRYDGIACSSACMFQDAEQGRMESVATLEGYRGKGLIGELISFIQKEAMSRGIKKLWVFPINESVEKVYQKYGFHTLDTLKMGHAFLGGKSIGEIREEN